MSDEDDSVHKDSFGNTLKKWLKTLSILSLLAFVGLVIFKMSGSGDSSSLQWSLVVLPLLVSFMFLFLWVVVNYFTTGIIQQTSGNKNIGSGGQYYYNLMSELLVKRLQVRDIENLNEAYMLRDILRGVVYVLIIFYSVSLTQQKCSCSVPYTMLSFGFVGTYLARFVMLIWNGFYSYHRLADMATEVRSFQESLDSTRLFDTAIEHLYDSSQRAYAMAMDLFLWVVAMSFAGLGTMWIMHKTCQSSCPAMFHVYNYLLMTVFLVEGASLLAKFGLLYYERVSSVEGLDRLVALIYEHQSKDGEMMRK